MIKTLLDYLYYIFEVFSSHISFFSKIYIKFHAPSVKKEIKMSHLSPPDKILHIGCGAIPYTSVIISWETEAEVTGIDHKSNIVNIANGYLKKYNIANKVKIQIGDGKTYDMSGFDVIIISYGVNDQDLVLKHVIDSIKDGVKVILRRSVTERNDYIDSIVKNYSVCSTRLLLTQESILIIKKT